MSDNADNVGLSPAFNTAAAATTKRGHNRKDERTNIEVKQGCNRDPGTGCYCCQFLQLLRHCSAGSACQAPAYADVCTSVQARYPMHTAGHACVECNSTPFHTSHHLIASSVHSASYRPCMALYGPDPHPSLPLPPHALLPVHRPSHPPAMHGMP